MKSRWQLRWLWLCVTCLTFSGCWTAGLGEAERKPAAIDAKRISAFGRYEGYSQPLYDEFVRTSLYVPVGDGTKLALDIYRPAVDGKPVETRMPTVFEFTRYWRARALPDGRISTGHFGTIEPGGNTGSVRDNPDYGAKLVQHGYVVVVGDNRGTGSSFGHSLAPLTLTEAQDARDLIDWIAEQPWSNGKVGRIGSSITGTNQVISLARPSPHLKAIFPGMANFEHYRIATIGGVVRKGGILKIYDYLKNLGTAASPDAPLPALVDADSRGEMRASARAGQGDSSFAGYVSFLTSSPVLDEVAAELGLKSIDERVRVLASNEQLIPAIAARPDLQRKLMSVGMYRDDRPPRPAAAGEQSLSVADILPAIRVAAVPTYIWSGWGDPYPGDAFLLFANLAGVRKVAIGPWSHGPNEKDDPREEEGIRLRAIETLRWFDYWLKGIDNGVTTEPPINYAVVDDAQHWEWRSATGWPLPQADNVDFNFQEGRAGSVSSVNDGGLSSQRPSQNDAADTFTVDYTATTGTHTRLFDTTGGGPLFYPDLADNDRKGLTYTTAPLEKDLIVIGHPVITIYATANVPDAEFSIYVEEIDADGSSRFVTDGYARALHRTLGKPPYDYLGLPWLSSLRADGLAVTPLSAGLAELTFDLQPIANRFEAGHRLRVTIQGADADNNWTFPSVPAASVTVARSASHPSRISLPVLREQ
jgi:predicted acyl esterase